MLLKSPQYDNSICRDHLSLAAFASVGSSRPPSQRRGQPVFPGTALVLVTRYRDVPFQPPKRLVFLSRWSHRFLFPPVCVTASSVSAGDPELTAAAEAHTLSLPACRFRRPCSTDLAFFPERTIWTVAVVDKAGAGAGLSRWTSVPGFPWGPALPAWLGCPPTLPGLGLSRRSCDSRGAVAVWPSYTAGAS